MKNTMSKNISIIDTDYKEWISDLSRRYRRSQIKAAVKVNSEVLRFYWSLGRDIVTLKAESKWGSKLMKNLSRDLKTQVPDATCFSETNLLYMKNFYLLFPLNEFTPQLVEQIDNIDNALVTQQLVEQLGVDIFAIPWGHYRYIVDKCRNNPSAALFFVKKTLDEGWSRDILLNFLATDLYEREGKALTNFKNTLPETSSDLAQELTRDPYCFAFTGVTGKHNERVLKDALLNNVTRFLLELGTGFAYVGKEYRLQIDVKEKFIDLLFYNLQLSCYVVVEVKIGEFDFQDVGQLQGYVVAANHLLRKEGRDNPTIGILICKSKNSTLAQYALEGSNQPIAISEYDLQKLYPTKVEGIIPSIEELEAKLNNQLEEGMSKND